MLKINKLSGQFTLEVADGVSQVNILLVTRGRAMSEFLDPLVSVPHLPTITSATRMEENAVRQLVVDKLDEILTPSRLNPALSDSKLIHKLAELANSLRTNDMVGN